MRDLCLVLVAQPSVKLDHAFHETRRENPHTAKVEQMQTLGVFGEPVIAEMGIAVDNAKARHRPPPGFEQQFCDAVARFLRLIHPSQQALAFKPRHGEEALGGKLFYRAPAC